MSLRCAVGEVDRGRLLDQLLVAALHRAVAFEEVHAVAVAVADQLHLGVAGGLQVALDVDGAVLEHGLRGGARGGVQAREVLGAAHHVHAAPAAAGDRLDDHRVADPVGDLLRLLGRLHGLDRAGQQRQAGLLHQVARDRLVPDLLHHLGARPDEGDPVVGADLGEEGVLGEEAIAGMDRVGAGLLRGADHVGDVQVALAGVVGPDVHGLVGEAHDGRLGVGGRVDRDRLDAELPAGARDSQRDLTPVGDQDLLEHALSSLNRRGRPGRLRCAAHRLP